MPISKDMSVVLYQSIRDGNEQREMQHWHASSLAACPRAQYMQRLKVPALTEPTGAKIIRWQAGHNLEKAIRPHIEKLYPGVGSNDRMTSKKYDLTGEYDNYSEELKTLIEVKSVSDYAFFEDGDRLGLKESVGKRINNRGREVESYQIKKSPYLHHEIQQHAYKLLLEEEGKEVEHIDYVYISLNGRIVVYKTEPDPDITRQVKARLEALTKAWDSKTAPGCICVEGHPLYKPVMQWCDYRSDNGCCNLNLIKEQE